MSAQSSSEMDNSNNNGNTTENSEKTGEKKRKKAMEEKKRSYLESKSVISEALSSLDDEMKRVNKKIKFRDSDQDDSCDEMEKAGEHESNGVEKKKKSSSADTEEKNIDTSSDKKKYKKKSDCSDKKKYKKTKSTESYTENDLDKEKGEEEARMFRRRERRKLLFGESDESDSDLEFDFSNKKNREFVELQSKLASDARFVLDDRFVESYSEESVEEGLNLMNINEADDEKKNQLDILQSVLGQQTPSTADTVEKKESCKPEGVRYDPLIKHHSKFEVKSDKKEGVNEKKGKKTVSNEEAKKYESTVNASKIENVQENDPVTAETSKYYHVDDQLIKNLQNDNATDFSLLQMFGNPVKKDKDQENIGESTSIPTKGKKRPALVEPKNPFKYDSSESESEEKKNNSKANKDDNENDGDKDDEDSDAEFPFFLSNDDPRVLEGFNLFRNGNIVTEKGFKEMRVKLKALLKKRAHNRAKKEAKTKDSAKKTKYS